MFCEEHVIFFLVRTPLVKLLFFMACKIFLMYPGTDQLQFFKTHEYMHYFLSF